MGEEVYGLSLGCPPVTSPWTERGRWTAVVVASAGLIVAAGVFIAGQLNESDPAACGTPFAERIDPGSSQHLLPGTPEPSYLSDPPTSGAHRLGNHATGALADPVERAVQVSMLESGEVLVQHRGLSTSALRELESLAGNHVTVAPNPTLDEPIVATAWLWKMTCSRVDVGALRDFADTHRLETSNH